MFLFCCWCLGNLVVFFGCKWGASHWHSEFLCGGQDWKGKSFATERSHQPINDTEQLWWCLGTHLKFEKLKCGLTRHRTWKHYAFVHTPWEPVSSSRSQNFYSPDLCGLPEAYLPPLPPLLGTRSTRQLCSVILRSYFEVGSLWIEWLLIWKQTHTPENFLDKIL